MKVGHSEAAKHDRPDHQRDHSWQSLVPEETIDKQLKDTEDKADPHKYRIVVCKVL